jgi:hypothetical protein
MTGESRMRIEVELFCRCAIGAGNPDGPEMKLTTDVEGSDIGDYRCPRCEIEIRVRVRATN